MGPVRGVCTLLGVAGAAFLIWLSTQLDAVTTGGYWSRLGLLAAAGVILVLSQLFGGWTKWGRPHVSVDVFLLAFLPALVVAGWVLVAAEPDANWFQRHIASWSDGLHVSRLVRHLGGQYLPMLAFGLGALLGMTLDTSGPRVSRPMPVPLPEPPAAPVEEPIAAPRPPDETETWVVRPAEAPTVVAAPSAPEDETRVAPPPVGGEGAHSREG